MITVTNSSVKNCIQEPEGGAKSGITGKAHVGGFLGFGRLVSANNGDTRSSITNCYIAGTKQLSDYNTIGYTNTDVGAIIGNSLANSYINKIDVTNCTVENNRLRVKLSPDDEYNYTEFNNHVGTYVGCNADKLDSNISDCTNSEVTVNMYEL